MSKVIKSIGYFFTGKYNAGNGNDTIHAYGFGGTINAYGGNDRVYLAGFSTTVNTGSGHDEVYAGSAYLKVNDTSGNLKVRGASGYTHIYKTESGNIDYGGLSGAVKIEHRSDGHITMTTAAFSNVVRHTGGTGDIHFTGAGLHNDIARTGRNGVVVFRGAGGSNKVSANFSEDRSWNRIDFHGAGLHNEISMAGTRGNVNLYGIGAYTKVRNTAHYGDLNFNGAGVRNEVTRIGRHGVLRFNGGGASNKVSASFSEDRSWNRIDFNGAGLHNDISLSGTRGNVNVNGIGAYTKINHTALYGDINFNGVGGYNEIKRDGRHGAVQFNGAGVGNKISANFSENRSWNRISFNGAGAANVITLDGMGTRQETYTAQERYLKITGYRPVRIWNFTFQMPIFTTQWRDVQRVRTVASNTGGGDIVFRGVGGANVLTHKAAYGDIDFEGVGGANILTLSGTSGNVRMRAGGALNVVTHTAKTGDINFAGAGLGNVLTRMGHNGKVYFSGVGAANIVTVGLSGNDAGNGIWFNGGGGGNVITLFGGTGPVRKQMVEETYADITYSDQMVDGALVTVATTVQKTRMVEREVMSGANGGRADIVFNGAGLLNVITHAAAYGDLTFNGAGAANVLTLTGAQGDITFKGAGGANVLTHTAQHGDITFYGAGLGNVLTRVGETGDINMYGAGSANILTSTVAQGDIVFNGAGQNNILTRVGGTGDITMNGVGGLNVLTSTAAHGDITFRGMGGNNILTRVGQTGHITMYGAGGSNVLTSTVDHGDMTFYGAGGANVLTRTGMTGDVTFIGAGMGNVVTLHARETGKATFYGIGKGNVITAAGGDVDIEMLGAGGANVVTNASATGETDVIAVAKGNLVTHTSDGDMRAWVAGGANIVTNVGNGHSDVIAVGKLNVVTLGDGGSDVIVAGMYNVVTAGSGFDKVLAIGKMNLVLTGGTAEGENDQVAAIGKMSIVDSGEGAKFMVGFAGDPAGALKDIAGVTEQVVADATGTTGEGTAAGVSSGFDMSALNAAALKQQQSGDIGADVGLEDVTEEDLAAAEAQASQAHMVDSSALLASATSSTTTAMGAAEAVARSEAEAEAEAGTASDQEAALDAEMTAQANSTAAQSGTTTPAAQSTGGLITPGTGVQDDAGSGLLYSILGIGFQIQMGDGVFQMAVGQFNLSFGSDGNDVMIGLGKFNVLFGGGGNDIIIAGSPASLIRNVDHMYKSAKSALTTNQGFTNSDGFTESERTDNFNKYNPAALVQTGLYNLFSKSSKMKSMMDTAFGAVNSVSDKLDKKTNGFAKTFTGAMVFGGAGDDVILLFSQANIAVAGSGNDTVLALGAANLIVKEEHGDLNVGLGGLGNIVVHTGGGDAERSNLRGLMMGRLNIVYAHDNVHIDGLVMMGQGNLIVKTGAGDVKAGMLGQANAIWAHGDGSDIVVQVGISGLNRAALGADGINAGSLFVRAGNGNSAFGQFGDLNVAVKVGNGHVLGAALAGTSLLVNVGDGNVIYIGASISENDSSWLVKVGDGNVNAFLMSLPYRKTDASARGAGTLLNAALDKAGKSKLSDGSSGLMNDIMSIVTPQNMALQVGDGTFTGVAMGTGNTMIRVGAGDGARDATQVANLEGQLTDLAQQGSITASLTKALGGANLQMGDYDTQMFALSFGGSNVMIDVNSHSLDAIPLDFDAERTRAIDLLKHRRIADADPDKARLTQDEFMSQAADGSSVATSNSLMVAIGVPSFGSIGDFIKNRKQNGNAGPQVPAGPQAPATTGPTTEHVAYDATQGQALPFDLRNTPTQAAAVAKPSAGRNVLLKVGNGDMLAVAASAHSLVKTYDRLVTQPLDAVKVSKYEAGQIQDWLYNSGTAPAQDSYLHQQTMAYLDTNQNPDWIEAEQQDRLKHTAINGSGYYTGGKTHELYDDARAAVKSELLSQARASMEAVRNGATPDAINIDVPSYAPEPSAAGNFFAGASSGFHAAGGAIVGIPGAIADGSTGFAKMVSSAGAYSKKKLASMPSALGTELMSGGGNLILHAGHGDSTMIAAGEKNIMVKAGIGNDVMIALGNQNFMMQVADPVTTQSLVEVGHDVQVAIGTGNMILNLAGTSSNTIVAIDTDSMLSFYQFGQGFMTYLADMANTKERDGYQGPSVGYGFYTEHIKSVSSGAKWWKDLATGKDGTTRGEMLSQATTKSKNEMNSWANSLGSYFTKGAGVKWAGIGRSIPIFGQMVAVGDGVKFLIQNIASANLIVGGRGADKIFAVGEFNIVFGDKVADVLEFDVRALLPANKQSFSDIAFNGGSIIPGLKVDFEIKTLNGDIGDYLGIVPTADSLLPQVDPEGAFETMKETWANYLDTAIFTNMYMPPVFGSIATMPFQVVSWFTSPLDAGKFSIGEWTPNFDGSKALAGGALTRVASRFDVLSLIDFDDLLAGGFSDDFQENMQTQSYLKGDGDLMMLMGGMNFAFGGFGNDVAISVGDTNVLTMGDGNDLAIAMGSDNRISGDDGADVLIALGKNNLVTGDFGDDIIVAMGNYNRIRGDSGEDILIAVGKMNLLFGGDGVDVMVGVGSKNLFYSGDGVDLVIGIGAMNYYASGGGSDLIFNLGFGSITEAGAGSDYINLGGAGNTVFGGADDDTFITDQDTRDAMASGGTGNDTMVTGGLDNLFLGGSGNDIFVISEVLKTGNIIGDARTGIVTSSDPTKENDAERDVIRLHSALTQGDPATMSALLNDVWFIRDGLDLKIETRATKDPTGKIFAGDVTINDYFDRNPGGGFVGPDIQIEKNDRTIIGSLTAHNIATIIGLLGTKTGTIDTSFFDPTNSAHGMSDAELLALDAITPIARLHHVEGTQQAQDAGGQVTFVDQVLNGVAGTQDVAIIGDLLTSNVNIAGFDEDDVIQIAGSAILGAGANAISIGDLLNDVAFEKVGDDLRLTTRAALDKGENRAKGSATITDYFVANATGFDAATIEVINDDFSVGASFTAAKVNSLIEQMAALASAPIDDTAVKNGFFKDPANAVFAARPMSDFV